MRAGPEPERALPGGEARDRRSAAARGALARLRGRARRADRRDRLGARSRARRRGVRAPGRAACADGDEKPDAVVLLGPFVDAENAVVRGDAAPLEQSFEEVFAHGVRDRLEAFLARADVDISPAPAIALVPSTRDATAAAAFPQPPLLEDGAGRGAPGRGGRRRGQPRVLRRERRAFRGVHAGRAAAPERRRGGARRRGPRRPHGQARAAHLPGQRSAYPLFPAARAACLDASLAAHLDMDVTPDVLVLPST